MIIFNNDAKSKALSHLVLLLKSSSRIGKPSGDLSQCHFSNNRQHDFLPFGGIWILFVLC